MKTEINRRTFAYSEASGTQPGQWFEIIQTKHQGERHVRVMADEVEKEAQRERDYQDWCEVQ